MEFIRKGGVPSAKFFYHRIEIDSFTGDTLEDFGFKEDCVVMTQDEYNTLKKERDQVMKNEQKYKTTESVERKCEVYDRFSTTTSSEESSGYPRRSSSAGGIGESAPRTSSRESTTRTSGKTGRHTDEYKVRRRERLA